MEKKFFIHEIRRTNGTMDKGIVVKENFDGAKQGFHAYLGAYAYGNNEETDFVSCMITDTAGSVLMAETWSK